MITDNAFAHRKSATFHAVFDAHVISQKLIKPHCPCANGKVERVIRTLGAEWAYTRASKSDNERAQALQSWIGYYNLERPRLGDENNALQTALKTVEVIGRRALLHKVTDAGKGVLRCIAA